MGQEKVLSLGFASNLHLSESSARGERSHAIGINGCRFVAKAGGMERS